MIGCPTSYDRVKLYYQLPGRAIPVLLDNSPNFLQEGFHILLCRCCQDRSALVLAYMLSEEVETILDVRDDRFLL